MRKSYRDKVYPWEKYSGNAVFRHADNKKWFALIMNVSKDKLGLDYLDDSDEVDVMNVKLDDPVFMELLLHQKGYLPAYHMNKKSWVSLVLDGRLST